MTELQRYEWLYGKDTLQLFWSDGSPITCADGDLFVYNGARSNKGAYTSVDLNRVGEAILYLADILNGYGYKVVVTPKTDWDGTETLQDHSLVAHYLEQVRKIRNTLTLPAGSPEVPADFEGLTYEEANDIERILLIAETSIKKMANSWFYTAEVWSGEV